MIRTLIIEDHNLVSSGLKLILLKEKEIHVVGTATKGAQGVQLVRKMQPQVVLLDIKLPDISGVEVSRRLLAINPALKILILTAMVPDIFSSRLLASGVQGYLTKDAKKEEIIQAIKTISKGKKILSAQSTPPYPENLSHLTDREVEVMLMMIRNQSVSSIAKQLFLDKKTIHTYRSRIFRKLNIKNSVCLINYLIKHKVFIPEDL